MKTKVYDMKVLTDNDCEFETSDFTTTINKIVEIVDNMSHEKLVYIHRIDEEETTTWALTLNEEEEEDLLELCHIDEDYPLYGDKMSMCHILFTLMSSGNYGLDNSYFEKE